MAAARCVEAFEICDRILIELQAGQTTDMSTQTWHYSTISVSAAPSLSMFTSVQMESQTERFRINWSSSNLVGNTTRRRKRDSLLRKMRTRSAVESIDRTTLCLTPSRRFRRGCNCCTQCILQRIQLCEDGGNSFVSAGRLRI